MTQCLLAPYMLGMSLQLARTTRIAILPNNCLLSWLLVLLGNQRAAVEILPRGRNIERRILIEEVGRLQRNLDNLNGHDREVFNSGLVLQPELHEHDNVRIHDILSAVGPRTNTLSAAGLIGVSAGGIEFSTSVVDNIYVVVCKLCPFVMEAVRVRNQFLERWNVNLVRNWLTIDRILHRRILNFEGAVGVEIEVKTTGLFHNGLLNRISNTMGIEV